MNKIDKFDGSIYIYTNRYAKTNKEKAAEKRKGKI